MSECYHLSEMTSPELKAAMEHVVLALVPVCATEQLGPNITNETPAPTQAVFIDDPEHVGPPKQSDTARSGMDIEIVRVVKENGVEVRRSPFITRFQEWPNIYVKNPKTPLPPGAKLGTG